MTLPTRNFRPIVAFLIKLICSLPPYFT